MGETVTIEQFEEDLIKALEGRGFKVERGVVEGLQSLKISRPFEAKGGNTMTYAVAYARDHYASETLVEILEHAEKCMEAWQQ